ncbi:MAG: hypothetical protein ACRDHL_01295, partial [Candidatus Promineifilaceae bacterium]
PNSEDQLNGLALDPAGQLWAAGQTRSADFPATPGSYDPTFGAGCQPIPCRDAFVARLSTAGSQLDYATFLGGPDEDSALGLAAVGAEVVAVGRSRSADFPRCNAFYGDASGDYDLFALRLRPAGPGGPPCLYLPVILLG